MRLELGRLRLAWDDGGEVAEEVGALGHEIVIEGEANLCLGAHLSDFGVGGFVLKNQRAVGPAIAAGAEILGGEGELH